MPRKRMSPRTKALGYRGAPVAPGQPSGNRIVKPDWKSASQGRNVIPRVAPNGSARINIFQNGGLDG